MAQVPMKSSKTFWSNINYRSRRVQWPKLLGWFGRTVVAAIVVVVVIFLVYLVFMPVTDWFARHDVETITGPGHAVALQAARDAARNRLLGAAAGVVALVALVYTARTFGLSREGQVTDRFAKAIGQLGDASLEVRVGAIYALETIVRDSRRNQQVVMELLAAFAREQSEVFDRERPKAQTSASAEGVPPANLSGHKMLPDVHDVHVAVAVIARRRHDRKKRVDLEKSTSSARTSTGRTSARRTLPARTSTAPTSPGRTSPTRTSPARTSPARTSSMPGCTTRTSPTRTSPARTSNKRTSPGRTSKGRTSPARTSTARSLGARVSRAPTSKTWT